MPSQKRKDDDLVPKDQPERSAKRTRGSQLAESAIQLPEPDCLPEWDPLVIENNLERGKPRLPCNLDRTNSIALFRLFFTDNWLETLIQCTNANAVKIQEEEANQDFRNARYWYPVDKYDIMRYLAAVIHMGLHPEAEISDYWADYKESGVLHYIREYISLHRWQQIDRFLYCEELRDGMIRTFERVWSFSEHVQTISCKYWTPGKNLAVDESMQLFTGRAKEITTIPCKKHATGYKIWILADHGYVMRFLFHSKGDNKGDGPYRLNPQWKREGFSATEAVVLDLVNDVLKPHQHIVWLDNLFTKVRLLERLRQMKIGAAGTCRPSHNQTPREERLQKKLEKAKIKKEKEAQKKIRKQEREAKREAAKEAQLAKRQAAKDKRAKKGKDLTQSTSLSNTVPIVEASPFTESASFPESNFLFRDLFESTPSLEWNDNTLKEKSPTVEPDSVSFPEFDEFPDAEPIEKEQSIDDGDPETNEPFNEDLSKLRSSLNHIEWGTKWFALPKNKTVAEMAWRDNNLVLFATTIGDPTAVVNRPRKRPGLTRTGATKTRKVFGEEVVKNLDIPVLIDQYNQHMGAVDQFDQLKSYYDTLRSHRKTWRPLFSLLLEIILVNSFKLSTLSDRVEAKQCGHRKFRLQLVKQLVDTAGKPVKYDPRRQQSVNDLQIHNGVVHTQGNLFKQVQAQPCVMCQSKGRRPPLQAVDPNRASGCVRKPASTRTTQGCIQCKIPLCRACCKEHLEAANSAGRLASEDLID